MQQPTKYFYKRLDSTNIYVSQFISGKAPRVPVWVRADEQYAGKGQGSNLWISQAGKNLTGSLALFPERLLATSQFSLSQATALAALSFLGLFIEEVTIKWPNDLYYRNQKIGGILIETAILGNRIDHAILGIGINVNQDAFPPDLPNPTSLFQMTGLMYDLCVMEDLLIESFLNQYSLIEAGRFRQINEKYIKNLYRFGVPADFRFQEKTMTAVITGVDGFGHLIVKDSNGIEKAFAYQEIQYVI